MSKEAIEVHFFFEDSISNGIPSFAGMDKYLTIRMGNIFAHDSRDVVDDYVQSFDYMAGMMALRMKEMISSFYDRCDKKNTYISVNTFHEYYVDVILPTQCNVTKHTLDAAITENHFIPQESSLDPRGGGYPISNVEYGMTELNNLIDDIAKESDRKKALIFICDKFPAVLVNKNQGEALHSMEEMERFRFVFDSWKSEFLVLALKVLPCSRIEYKGNYHYEMDNVLFGSLPSKEDCIHIKDGTFSRINSYLGIYGKYIRSMLENGIKDVIFTEKSLRENETYTPPTVSDKVGEKIEDVTDTIFSLLPLVGGFLGGLVAYIFFAQNVLQFIPYNMPQIVALILFIAIPGVYGLFTWGLNEDTWDKLHCGWLGIKTFAWPVALSALLPYIAMYLLVGVCLYILYKMFTFL